MSKKLQICISKDGSISSRTLGIKGKKCLDYLKIIEQITESKIIDSEFTSEYYESPNILRQNESEYIEEEQMLYEK